MNKAVMRSLSPQVCERIANGKQTMLVVKQQPKLKTPYKEYIYCTSRDVHSGLVVGNGSASLIKCCNYKTGIVEGGEIGNGKVVGEYMVDKITRYHSEFWDDETYERIQKVYEPIDFEEYGEYEYETIAENDDDNRDDNPLCNNACLMWEELRKYIGQGIRDFYGLHISNLVIYDMPKELGEFEKPCDYSYNCRYCNNATHSANFLDLTTQSNGFTPCNRHLSRPPRSCFYVEEA